MQDATLGDILGQARKEMMEKLLGLQGTINVDGLTINVTIKDSRIRFGHTDVLITPVNGSGEKWVEHTKVSISA